MAYGAILGRRLDAPVINLGFSGLGQMNPEVGALLAEIEAAAFVIDCGPNMPPQMITERAAPFVTALRQRRPRTPIILVGNISYPAGFFHAEPHLLSIEKNKALRAAYDGLPAVGVGGLY
jgi:hypothetical protein